MLFLCYRIKSRFSAAAFCFVLVFFYALQTLALCVWSRDFFKQEKQQRRSAVQFTKAHNVM
jgi:hypothetical protein